MKHLRLAIASILLVGAGLTLFFYNRPTAKIQTYYGNSFQIPHNCKNLGLLGCTPHPTNYLKEHGGNVELLNSIKLTDFLDINYVRDSFTRTFALCKEHSIDHLLIAYLPIYYIGMRQLLGNQYLASCRHFLKRIVPEIVSLIEELSRASGYQGGVTLIIPPDYQVARVPHELTERDDRTRYLIKQFPSLKNISQSALEVITIINNKESDEDNLLINYLKYEYLYEKPITYKKCNTGKERFHADKRKA